MALVPAYLTALPTLNGHFWFSPEQKMQDMARDGKWHKFRLATFKDGGMREYTTFLHTREIGERFLIQYFRRDIFSPEAEFAESVKQSNHIKSVESADIRERVVVLEIYKKAPCFELQLGWGPDLKPMSGTEDALDRAMEAMLGHEQERKQRAECAKIAVPPIQPVASTSLSHVYFIQCEESKMVKIGKANNVQERLKGLQTAHYDTLKIVRVIENVSISVEKQLHERFAEYRLRGEWFKPDVLDLVTEGRAISD